MFRTSHSFFVFNECNGYPRFDPPVGAISWDGSWTADGADGGLKETRKRAGQAGPLIVRMAFLRKQGRRGMVTAPHKRGQARQGNHLGRELLGSSGKPFAFAFGATVMLRVKLCIV